MKPEVEIEQMLSAGERVTGAAAFAPAHGSLLQDQGLGQRSTTARPRRTECECCGDEMHGTVVMAAPKELVR